MFKKKPSIEDLLKAAQQEGKVKYTEKEKDTDIRKFLLDNCIETGTMSVDKHFLYVWYLSWTKKENPPYNVAFHKVVRKFVKYTARKYKIRDLSKLEEEKVKKEIVKTIFKRAKVHVKKANEEKEKSTKS